MGVCYVGVCYQSKGKGDAQAHKKMYSLWESSFWFMV
jgi:hypothetical protein